MSVSRANGIITSGARIGGVTHRATSQGSRGDAVQASSAISNRILGISTVAFTVCFAVWSIFSIIGIEIKQQLGLDETEFGLLIGTPILSGSLIRLALGVCADRRGGRLVFTLVMLAGGIATFLLS